MNMQLDIQVGGAGVNDGCDLYHPYRPLGNVLVYRVVMEGVGKTYDNASRSSMLTRHLQVICKGAFTLSDNHVLCESSIINNSMLLCRAVLL